MSYITQILAPSQLLVANYSRVLTDETAVKTATASSGLFTAAVNVANPISDSQIIQQMSLENEYQEQICVPVDIYAQSPLKFLRPNEGNPIDVKPHLDQSEDPNNSVIVVTGTERVIFDLISGVFQGIISRDINPRVKAYLDFLILLVRLSSNRQEFVYLAETPATEKELLEKSDMIINKIPSSDIPFFMKKYYLSHAKDFSRVFYKTSKHWIETSLEFPGMKYFQGVQYYADDQLFAKFQKYAKSGMIITTIGDINDLSFLANRKISAVDASNIHNYSIIDLKCSPSQPRIIWTSLQRVENRSMTSYIYQTVYHSYVHQELDKEQRQEMDHLVIQLKQASACPDNAFAAWLCNYCMSFSLQNTNPFNDVAPASYSPVTLLAARVYFNRFVYNASELGLVDLLSNIKRLNSATPDQLARICQDPNIRNYLPVLVSDWAEDLSIENYLAFIKIDGWKEEFGKQLREIPEEAVAKFFQDLKEKKLLIWFVTEFGKEMIHTWNPRSRIILDIVLQGNLSHF